MLLEIYMGPVPSMAVRALKRVMTANEVDCRWAGKYHYIAQ